MTSPPLSFCKNNKPELYQKYEKGQAENIPGVDLPFMAPANPALTLQPQNRAQNVKTIMEYMADYKIFPIV